MRLTELAALTSAGRMVSPSEGSAPIRASIDLAHPGEVQFSESDSRRHTWRRLSAGLVEAAV